LTAAESAAAQRDVHVSATEQAQQRAVPMDEALTLKLYESAQRVLSHDPLSLFSGAGHDAMILAPAVPTTMLFLRSPNGLSHHPEESVREQDVEAALATVLDLIQSLGNRK
jgi:allantoate deiminase